MNKKKPRSSTGALSFQEECDIVVILLDFIILIRLNQCAGGAPPVCMGDDGVEGVVLPITIDQMRLGARMRRWRQCD